MTIRSLATIDAALGLFEVSNESRSSLEALSVMSGGAEWDKESTKEPVVQQGIAARLGERSKGVLDSGATSAWLILYSIARSMQQLLELVTARVDFEVARLERRCRLSS